MSPKDWGPPIWMLFHTMAEKVNEADFENIGPQMFNMIKQICRNLPCPDCANHATTFLNTVKPSTIKTKNDFKLMLWFFHNQVNKRKDYQIYTKEDLAKYATYSMPDIFNKFALSYNKKNGNLKLMADSLERRRIIIYVSNWFKQNSQSFV
jgi:hypothetical protein